MAKNIRPMNKTDCNNKYEAFTTLTYTRDLHLDGPIKQNEFEDNQKDRKSKFRIFVDRGDIPITLNHGSSGRGISWRVDLQKIDYNYYLPLFFEGLVETKHPYSYFAREGIVDLLRCGDGKVLEVLPQLIMPMKNAQNRRDPKIVCAVLKAIQQLILCDERIGEALVPYYRCLLPKMRRYLHHNKNIGDGIEYSQMKRENLGDLVVETLQLLELSGGENAFLNIKFSIPTYESCLY